MIDIKVFGMMRSGHHAIINWIYQQIESAVFKNNIFHPKYKEYDFWQKGESPTHCIYNIEDLNIGNYEKRLKRFGFGSSGGTITILVVRDFYNLFASRLKYSHLKRYSPIGWASREAINMWKSHANHNKNIIINFNYWFSDINYRKKIADKLDIDFTDAGVNDVKNFGLGSSFDQLNYDGKANQMKILERYKEFDNCIKNKMYSELEEGELFYHMEQEWEKINNEHCRKIDSKIRETRILADKRMKDIDINDIVFYENKEWIKTEKETIERNGVKKIIGGKYFVKQDITPYHKMTVNSDFLVKTVAGRFFEIIDKEIIKLNRTIFNLDIGIKF